MSQIELFDYRQLSQDLQVDVRLATERIRMRMKRTAEDVIEIGKDLIAIKERLLHGQFLPWIRDEFGMTRQTANSFMQAADRFGDEMSDYLTFSPTVLQLLASPSTSDEVVEKAI